MTLNIGKFWQQNRPELNIALEAGEFTANITAAGLGLAIALGVANPFVEVTAAGLVFVGLGRKVIEAIAQKWNKKLTLEEVVAITAPLAYVKSFNSWIERNSILAEKIKPEQNQEIQVDSNIANLILNEQLATNALRNFHRSELAQTFNQILSSQLIKQGFNQTEVEIIVPWVAWEAGRYLKEEVKVLKEKETSNSKNLLAFNLSSIYINASQEDDHSPYKSIEAYLAKQIATQPQEKVFNEEFTFADIYVHLKPETVYANSKVNKAHKEKKKSFAIVEDWAKEMLFNPQKREQVMFIQAAPGRGKTVFCRMFADEVRRKIYPLWIPIFIRLRNITSFDPSFEKTLQEAVKADFAKEDDWLYDSKLRFLFFLDGFDELQMEGRARGGIERFIKQVSWFQKSCDRSEMGHRFIVTGRQLALQGISYLPDNLERVELLPMNEKLQKDWLNKWQKVVNKDAIIAQKKTAAFKKFLQSNNLPKEVKKDLAREPLLLYLLAAMHRDGKIKVKDLEGTSGIKIKITIYEKALNWVLTEQRKPIQREIVRLEEDELRQVLLETGLSVVQSGVEFTKMKSIEKRLSKSKPKIVDKIQDIRTNQGDKVLKNALAAFYLKPASTSEDDKGAVEFFHKSFGEFLCAKRMQQSMEKWTKWDDDENKFCLNKEQLAEEIYDLLGYGGLTLEIVEYLFGLLAASKFAPVKLFNRLEDFYLRWGDGKFIDAPSGNNYPQQKMELFKEQKPKTTDKQDILGLRQVDVYTGLNVMILLLELHRYSQHKKELKEIINFHPCGKHNQERKLKDRTRLFRIIGYSYCLNDVSFRDTVGNFLSNANLSNADLRRTDLISAKLSNADLRNADLRNADLSYTNLRHADLRNANLSNAKLSYADLGNAKLSYADLSYTNLSYADLNYTNLSYAKFDSADLSYVDLSNADLTYTNLRYADLRDANLNNTNLRYADLKDIQWNVKTNFSNESGLVLAVNVPEDLKKLLSTHFAQD